MTVIAPDIAPASSGEVSSLEGSLGVSLETGAVDAGAPLSEAEEVSPLPEQAASMEQSRERANKPEIVFFNCFSTFLFIAGPV